MSIRLTYLGHATVLLQDGPLTLLTDPVYSERVLLTKRKQPFPLALNDLPRPSAVLITNAHYDHLDLHSLKFFDSEVPFILPPGIGKLVAKFVRNPILEIPHGNTHDIVSDLKVTAFPVAHRGFRLSGLTYRETNGYWIEMNGSKIFYPGDTGYRDDFAAYRHPDLALLPIHACKPGWILRRRHMTAADAVRVMEETGARKMIPLGWGTFGASYAANAAPIDDLKQIVSDRGFGDRVAILNEGEALQI